MIMSEEKTTEEFCHFDRYYRASYVPHDIDLDSWEYYHSEDIKKKSWFPFHSYDVGYRIVYRKRTKEQQLEYFKVLEAGYLHYIETIQVQAEENLVRVKDTVQSLQQKIIKLSKATKDK